MHWLLNRRRRLSGEKLKYIAFQAAAQMIPLAAAPIITRLYTTAQYGALGVFGAISVIGVSLATGRYERAALLAEDEAEAVDVTRLALLCAAAFSTIFFLG